MSDSPSYPWIGGGGSTVRYTVQITNTLRSSEASRRDSPHIVFNDEFNGYY